MSVRQSCARTCSGRNGPATTPSVHSTPAQVAYIFENTRPRIGVYSHIIPPELTSEQILSATDYDGEMLVAVDLMTLTIGDIISVGRATGSGTDIFTEADVVQ